MIKQAAGEGRKILIGVGGVVVIATLIALPFRLLGHADGTEEYCHAVTSHQAGLSEIVAGGDKDALIEALPDFRAIAEHAPDDIAPSWTTVIDAVAGLQRAVASKDASSIKAAATTLTDDQVTTALADVQQQVRDVCHTPLTL